MAVFRPQGSASQVLAELARLYDQACVRKPGEVNQKKLASASGVPYSTVNGWATGTAEPRDLDRLVKVGAVLADWAHERALSTLEWSRMMAADRSRPAHTIEAAGGVAAENVAAERIRIGSAYLQQRMMPPALVDRDGELEELARFCVQPAGPSYVWWQAGPWAGKSALLSTFVLRPPPEVASLVRIVFFFIEGRRASHNNVEGFIRQLLGQLSDLLGRPVPTVTPPGGWEDYLLELLSQAAEVQQKAGRRLVLVVDGLDEDRGAANDAGARNIAALLPADPPHGMRVIVTGRSNPPLADMPDWHPLKYPSVIRILTPFQGWDIVRDQARNETRRLLQQGSAKERKLLGFLTVARGDLSARDLAKLAEIDLWDAESFLDTGEGSRMLQGRPGITAAAGRSGVFRLGHEEIRNAAEEYLHDQLDSYRERLNSWADDWCERRWPSDTPEYLLVDHFHLLDDLGDLPRMTRYALDVVRHERLLALTGGDAAALGEVRAALDRIAAQDTPDLDNALALSCHRGYLAGRSNRVPIDLPAVWAALGQVPKAVAMANSFTYPDWRVQALARISEALAKRGQQRKAIELADDANSISQEIAYRDDEDRDRVLAHIARALAWSGGYRQALELVRANDYLDRGSYLTRVIRALAESGRGQEASDLAQEISILHEIVSALADISCALAKAGDHLGAARVAEDAEDAARTIIPPTYRAHALACAAQALVKIGNHRKGKEIVGEAESLIRDLKIEPGISDALSEVVKALTRCGEYKRAIALALALALAASAMRRRLLTDIAVILAETVEFQQIMDTFRGHDIHWNMLVVPLARTGKYEKFREIFDDEVIRHEEIYALSEVALEFADTGQDQRAREIATQVEITIRGSRLPKYDQAEKPPMTAKRAFWAVCELSQMRHSQSVVADIAGALAASGQYQQAIEFARSADFDLGWSCCAESLAEIAIELARTGNRQAAAEACEEAIEKGRRARNKAERWFVSVAAVRALAWIGRHKQAQVVASSAFDSDYESFTGYGRFGLLVRIARELTLSGRQREAIAVIAEAETIARRLELGKHQHADYALGQVAEEFSWAGQHERANNIGRRLSPQCAREFIPRISIGLSVSGQGEQGVATEEDFYFHDNYGKIEGNDIGIIVGLARTGQWGRAMEIIHDNSSYSPSAEALAEIAIALARVGESRPAARMAASACAKGKWEIAIRPVLMIKPSALTTLVHVLEEQPPLEE